VDIYDRTLGQVLPVYGQLGQRYIAGEPGHEYAIRIRNCTERRLLAVVSVDGVNVISGKTAAADQGGYVINPGEFVNILGWRKDLTRVADFYFSDPQQAYATQTGRPANLGVIGVALFRERENLPVESPLASMAAPPGPAAADAGRTAAKAAEADARNLKGLSAFGSLGTGHGRREDSPVDLVDFERAGERPDQLVAIRYERRDTLLAMGVLPEPHGPSVRRPDPFPGTMSFVPDP